MEILYGIWGGCAGCVMMRVLVKVGQGKIEKDMDYYMSILGFLCLAGYIALPVTV